FIASALQRRKKEKHAQLGSCLFRGRHSGGDLWLYGGRCRVRWHRQGVVLCFPGYFPCVPGHGRGAKSLIIATVSVRIAPAMLLTGKKVRATNPSFALLDWL